MTRHERNLMEMLCAVVRYYLRRFNPGGFGTELLARIDMELNREDKP